MPDGRSPRIHLTLTIWTVLLIGLVVVEIRRLPPGLTALLVPYLAVMGSQWMGHLRQKNLFEPAMALDDRAESSPEGQLDEAPDFPGSGGYSGHDDPPTTTSPRRDEEQVTPPSRRTRVRRRPRTPEPDPSTAAWVQVGPGRFVRAVEMSPEQPADESDGDSRPDAPHANTPSHEPGATPESCSIPSDAETAVAESEPRVNHAERDAAETLVPDWEIGEEVIAGSLATTSYLIGCPSGDPTGRGGPPPR